MNLARRLQAHLNRKDKRRSALYRLLGIEPNRDLKWVSKDAVTQQPVEKRDTDEREEGQL